MGTDVAGMEASRGEAAAAFSTAGKSMDGNELQ